MKMLDTKFIIFFQKNKFHLNIVIKQKYERYEKQMCFLIKELNASMRWYECLTLPLHPTLTPFTASVPSDLDQNTQFSIE